MIYLPDTSYEAFELFVKILYSEPLNLNTISLNLLDQLYHLAEKYLVFEMQASIVDAAKSNAQILLKDVQDIEILIGVTSDPVKEAITEVVIQFLKRGRKLPGGFLLQLYTEDISFLATAYYSGFYSDPVKEAIVDGFKGFNRDGNVYDAFRVFADIPQSEDNSKFIHMLCHEYY